jgi:hypothetical protein
MLISKLIEGLTILEKYRDRPNGCKTGAEHGCIFGFATDRPLSEIDLQRIVELGWFQNVSLGGEEETQSDFDVTHYDPEQCWCFCV